MHLTFTFSVFALVCVLHVSHAAVDIRRANSLFRRVKKTPLVKSNQALIEKVRQKVIRRGCDVNVCFALDGSGSVGNDFRTQKDFVRLIAAIIGADDEAQFAATVYGLVNNNISKLSSNAGKFLRVVAKEPFPMAPVTFISAGLGFCLNQLDDLKLQQSANRIVVLADGFTNCVGLECSTVLLPIDISQQWRDLNPGNNLMNAVAVGFSSVRALEAIIGDSDRVLEVADWPNLLHILEELIDQICFVKRPPPPPPCPCICIVKIKNGVRDGAKAKAVTMRKCEKLTKCSVKKCGPKAFECCG